MALGVHLRFSLLALLMACGPSTSEGGGPAAATTFAQADAGVPKCPAAWVKVDGICRAPGVPEGECGAGFLSDGSGACTVVLPSTVCPKGQMALPGDKACALVAPCPAGQWGDIVTSETTQFVDAYFVGPGSNGSKKAPWKTIGQGILAAKEGATVAIGTGRYIENVVVPKRIVVHGTCPSQVQIVGDADAGALFVNNASRAEIRGLSVQGSAHGIVVGTSTDVVLENVWVHDTAGYGIAVSNGAGPASLTVRHALIENAAMGVTAFGAALTVEQVAVRDIVSDNPQMGRCIASQDLNGRPRVSVSSSHLERCQQGIFAAGADLTVEATEIRDMRSRGVNVQSGTAGASATATLRTTLIERPHDIGVAAFGADLTMDRVVVSSVLPAVTHAGGNPVWIQYDNTAKRAAKATIIASTLQDGSETGLANYGADVTVTSTLIRRIKVRPLDLSYGDGLLVTRYIVDAKSTVNGLRVEAAARAAVSNFGGTIALASTVLECNGIDLDGEEEGSPFTFDNSGDNVCGCDGSVVTCQVQSTALRPPSPIER